MGSASMTIMLLSVAYYALQRQMDHNYFAKNASPINGTIFDFIIVGGGTTGCILSNRLSLKLNATVLLLEAGGPQSVITDMIGNTQYLIGGEFDWNYNVQRQRFAGQAYPEFSISRGKVLGGTSTTQWGIYNRGNRQDYNNWATRYGLSSMSWSNVYPYFLAFENNTDQLFSTNGFHNYGGLVSISTETKPDPVLISFRDLMNQHGYPTIDINSDSQYGTTITQMFYNGDTGIKSSTANAYIESTNQTSNGRITILTRSMVERILFDDVGVRATGIVFRKNEHIYVVSARYEVILAAGPINTPQILMLSGIGPADHLSQLNIPIIKNLSVGNNLHDMIFVPLYYRLNDTSLFNPYPRFDANNLYKYFRYADGPLAHHADGLTYFSSSQNNGNAYWPDTMIISVVEFFNDLNGTVLQYVNNTNQWRKYWEPYANDGYYLAIDPVLARPRSRGTVRLNPSNIYGPPLIDPNYLSHEADFKALFDVTWFAVQALRRYPLKGVEEFPPIPGCPIPCITDILCEAYLRCHIRSLARSYYNFAGTARMGLTNDSEAVVDEQFRVIGIENLRVVDASIIPEIPNGHITAATIMLGEKGANLIIQENRQKFLMNVN